MRTLLVDNYDSFSYNLFQFIAKVNGGSAPEVIRNDSVSWDIFKNKLSCYDCIVISPGPGLSSRESDFGICQNILKEVQDIPILGVCLGHQGMAESEGGKVVHAPYVAHGILSQIRHNGSALFDGIPVRFRVVRYHSWIVDSALPSNFEVTAVTDDDDQLVMAIQHRKKPFYGVQFHPESIATEFGINIIRNFMNIVMNFGKHVQHASLSPFSLQPININPRKPTGYRIMFKKLPLQLTGEDIFLSLCEKKSRTFWLDSSRVEKSLSRFSFIGNTDGPHSFVAYYEVHGRRLTEMWRRREDAIEEKRVVVLTGDIFTYIKEKLDSFYCTPEDLPFEFQCGFVGYFGYEVSKECGHVISPIPSSTPDAAFLFVDRVVALDHQEGHLYILTMVNDTTAAEGAAFLLRTEQLLFAAERGTTRLRTPAPEADVKVKGNPISFRLERDYDTYLADIQTCHHQISNGESYELCLTNKIWTSYKPENPLEFYLKLRQKNRAPFSSFLQFDDFSVASSSPERFISVSRMGDVEAKPIKGTLPRGSTAEEDEILRKKLSSSKKDFSENLMILDLMRNDIGIVCQIGSVHVPSLMVVESYTSVHQLVSTVRGKILPHITPSELLRHVFPPGSMTGAPKKRSIQILQTCEKLPRGIYSGVIGFLSVTHTCDLNVVIRTAVIEHSGTSIGCGGAIVSASDPEEEFWEMALKASALVHTLSGMDSAEDIYVDGVPGPLRRIVYRNCALPVLELKEDSPNVVFQLLETMLFEPEGYYNLNSNTDAILDASCIMGGGFFLLHRHLQRLRQSANFFRFRFNEDEILTHLTEAAREWYSCMRVRLLLSHNGKITVQSNPLTPLVPPNQQWRVRLAQLPVDSSDVFLRNKTTSRKIYDDLLSAKGSANDVLLWNEKKEITETCFANIAVRWSATGTWFTPPVSCGLLAGTMREELLEKGIIKERVITVQELVSPHEIVLFDSVRRCFPAQLIIEDVEVDKFS